MALIQFNPNNSASPPFSTNVTLDNATYLLQCHWNVVGVRWYFSITDQGGNLIYYSPLIGSPDTYDIPLANGIFTTSRIIYRSGTGNFEITP